VSESSRRYLPFTTELVAIAAINQTAYRISWAHFCGLLASSIEAKVCETRLCQSLKQCFLKCFPNAAYIILEMPI